MDNPESEEKKTETLREKIKNILFFLLRISLAAGIIGYLAYSHYDELKNALSGFAFIWLVPALALFTFQLAAGALRWRMLLKVQGIEVSFYESLSLTMQGLFFSLVMFGGALGGDVVKAAFLTKRAPSGKKLAGAFTILIDRVVGMISLFSLAGLSAVVSWHFISGLSGIMEIVLYSLLFGCLTGLIGGSGLFFHRTLEKIPLVKWVIDHADRVTKGAVHHMMDAMDSFRSAWGVLLKTIVISVVCIHLVVAMVVYCIGQGLHSPPASPVMYVLSTSLGNAAGTIPITPSGTGTRDAVMSKVLAAVFLKNDASLSPAGAQGAALAVALLYTGIMLSFNLLGGLFFIMDKNTESFKSIGENTATGDES